MIKDTSPIVMGERVQWIDLYKGIGIVTMIMGHVGCPSFLKYFFHAFHMPMFFIISGWLFNRKIRKDTLFRKYMLSKYRSLLVPYFIWGG